MGLRATGAALRESDASATHAAVDLPRNPLATSSMRSIRYTTTCALALLAAPTAFGMQLEQTEQDKLQPTTPKAFDQFGESVAVDGPWMLIGSPETVSTGLGAVFAWRDNGGGFALQQEITAPGGALNFGKLVAVDGSTAVVAGYANVYAYEEVAGPAWALDQTLPPSGGNPAAYGVALAVDGNTIAVGQFGLSEERVIIWVKSGANWAIQQVLTVNGGATGAGFGVSCALSGDTLVAGSRDDDELATNAGAFYVFRRTGTVWSQQAKVLGTAPYNYRRLGASVDIQPLGGGQFEIVSGAIGPNSGTGRVYAFTGAMASWTQTANLLPATGGSGGWFGYSVALDGDRLVAGSPFGDRNSTDDGLATLYRRCGATWVRQTDLVASDGMPGDNLGRSVAAQAGFTAVGARSDDDSVTDEGAVYLYDPTDAPLVSYCHGDGSGTPCPCGNDAAPGTEGGCENSTGVGALLLTDDGVAVATDKLRAYSCDLLPNQPALLFAGNDAVNGGAGILFGDGLRCAGTNVVRLGVQTPDANGDATWGPGLGAIGGWSAGDTRFFQTWYRNPAGGPCATGFNLTNGVEVTFEP